MIIIKHCSKSTDEKELFSDLSLTLNRGDRLGVIGQNGCGKSTLLRMIAGHEDPDSGTIERAQEQVLMAPQEIDAPPGATVGEYLCPEEYPDVWRLLSELQLIALPLDTSISQLSGGQKTKLLLIKTFAHPSTTLLLDEPTNHLDSETHAWLMNQVLAYEGIIIVISHDRAFLNACATVILEIDSANHQTTLFHGNYDFYTREKARWRERTTDDYHTQQHKKKEMMEWITLKRQEATVHPSPAKGRQLRQMERRLEREITSQEIAKPKVGKVMISAEFAGTVHTGKLMLRLAHIQKTYGENVVLRDVTFDLRGASHVRLVGENGSGKSTLIKTITSAILADSGTVTVGDNVRIGYFAQQLETLDERKDILTIFTSIPGCPLSESRARAILGAFLFTGDAIYKKIRNLSHGERVRLQLAVTLQQEYQLLILDEPTNHLDIPSREVIESALRVYGGALLIVSHDEYFLRSIGIDTELVLRDGVVKVKAVKKVDDCRDECVQ